MSKQIIRLLNFDPSLYITGWSVIDYNVANGKIIVNRFGSIKPTPTAMKPIHKNEVERYGKRIISLNLLRKQIRELTNRFNPDFVIINEPVCDSDRLNEYASLIQWQCVVSMLYFKEFNMSTFNIVGKSAYLCVSSHNMKISIQEAIHSNARITFKQKVQAQNITESESKSVAVGYFFVTEQLPSILEFNQSINKD